MKSIYIGLYAAGVPQHNMLNGFREGVFLKELCAKGELPGRCCNLAFPFLKDVKSGIHIVIIKYSDTVDIKVLPLDLSNQKLLKDAIPADCMDKVEAAVAEFFGLQPETDSGDPSPAYVDQDRA